MTILKRLSSARVWYAHQSWHFEALWTLDDKRLRVHIRRNAYDDQSHARVEVFDQHGLQWNALNSMPITSLACKKISYVQENIKPQNFAADEETLLHEAQLILLGPGTGIELLDVKADKNTGHISFQVYLDDEFVGYGDLFARDMGDLCDDGLPSVGGAGEWIEALELDEQVRNLAIAKAKEIWPTAFWIKKDGR